MIVSPLPLRIDAGAESALTVTFDPTAEPNFRGGLSVDLVGNDPTGAVVFRVKVAVVVVKAETLGAEIK